MKRNWIFVVTLLATFLVVNAIPFNVHKRDISFRIHKRATTFSKCKEGSSIPLDVSLDPKFDPPKAGDFATAMIRFTTTFNITKAFLNTEVSNIGKFLEITTSNLCKLGATCPIEAGTGFEIESYI